MCVYVCVWMQEGQNGGIKMVEWKMAAGTRVFKRDKEIKDGMCDQAFVCECLCVQFVSKTRFQASGYKEDS